MNFAIQALTAATTRPNVRACPRCLTVDGAETTERVADRLREQLNGAEAELERHNKERAEVAERLTEFMNDVLLRLRPRTSVAEAA